MAIQVLIPVAMEIVKEITPIALNLINNSNHTSNEGDIALNNDKVTKIDLLIGLCAYISFADGVVEESEMEKIFSIFSTIKTEEIEAKIRKYVIEPLNLDDLPKFFFKKKDREDIWKMCYMVALSATKIDSSEQEVLNYLQDLFLLNEEDIGSLKSEVEKVLDDMEEETVGHEPAPYKNKFKSFTHSLQKKTNAAKKIYDKLDNDTKGQIVSSVKQIASKVGNKKKGISAAPR